MFVVTSLSITHSPKYWHLSSLFQNLVTMTEFGVLFLVTYESISDLMVHAMPFTWIPIPSIFTTTFIPNRDQSCSDEKMAPLSRFEISRPELVEANEEVVALCKNIGWSSLFGCFSGHNTEFTRQFALSLKENVTQIKGFQFIINEDKITEATKLPQTGERWFKGGRVDKKRCKSLLLPLPANAKLKFGVSVKFLEPKWKVSYEVLVMYVSYDDRLSHIL